MPRWTIRQGFVGGVLALALVAPASAPPQTATATDAAVSRATKTTQATGSSSRKATALKPSSRSTPVERTRAARDRQPDRADIFRGLGAWLDMYAYDGANPQRTAATMARHGVRTFYIQTGTSYTKRAVNPKVGPWLEAAHDHGIEVVGWYLPSYKNMKADILRTVAAARYSYRGHRFDGIGLDIEDRSVYKNPHRFAERSWKHAMYVRRRLGPTYPIAAIPPTPLQMRVAPNHWAGFPWKQLAQHTDAMLLMSYWSDRAGCPGPKPQHCPYPFTKLNVEMTRRLTGGKEIIHVIGGLSTRINAADVAGFVAGARAAKADGASLYEVTRTKSSWWPILSKLRTLGQDEGAPR